MPTGDSRVNLRLKRMLSHTRLSGNFFEFLRDECLDAAKRIFKSESGLFDNPVTLTVDFTGNTISIVPTVTSGMTSEGNVLTTSATHASLIPFDNTGTYVYFVGLSYCEVPDGIYVNQRTNVPEYDTWKSEIGLRGTPDSVTDNGDGTITFDVSSLIDPYTSVDHSGRTVKVWLKNPVAMSESIAIEDCTVTYSVTSNLITTSANSLGQGVISTIAADYQVALIGPQVVANGTSTTYPFSDDVIYIGQITGGSPGSVAYTYQNYLYEIEDHTAHSVQNILLNTIPSRAYSTNSPEPMVLGCYDESLGINTIINSDEVNNSAKEYVSYNAYEYYDSGAALPWVALGEHVYDLGCDNNGNRVIATSNDLYYSINMGAWTAWGGATSIGKRWAAVQHDHSSLWVMVDSTNGDIYTAATVGGALTIRTVGSPASTADCRHILVHTHHPAGLISPTDPGNPYWLYMDYNGSLGTILGSVDGITWSTLVLSGHAVWPDTMDVLSGSNVLDRISKCLAYSPISQRWCLINRDGTATGANHPTIIYSDDNGQTWTEIDDAFGFVAGGTGKYPNLTCGRRCITYDNKGNFLVTFIRQEVRVNKGANYYVVMYFASVDEGLTWFRVFGKQLEDAHWECTDVHSWTNGTSDVQFYQSGYNNAKGASINYSVSTIKTQD